MLHKIRSVIFISFLLYQTRYSIPFQLFYQLGEIKLWEEGFSSLFIILKMSDEYYQSLLFIMLWEVLSLLFYEHVIIYGLISLFVAYLLGMTLHIWQINQKKIYLTRKFARFACLLKYAKGNLCAYFYHRTIKKDELTYLQHNEASIIIAFTGIHYSCIKFPPVNLLFTVKNCPKSFFINACAIF